MLRRFLRCLWANFLAASGCLWWAKRRILQSRAVIALTFHRVLNDSDNKQTCSLDGIVIRKRTFRELSSHVAACYEPVDLRTAKPGVRHRKLPVVFTFDDGWIDTYTVAFPIAREHQIPIVVFVCPELLDETAPFWPERLVALMRAAASSVGNDQAEQLIESLKRDLPEERERYLANLREKTRGSAEQVEPMSADRTMSCAAIRQMVAGGVCIGSHTQSHQILTMISPDSARRELHDSKAFIESTLSQCCDTFAYPNGNCSPETRALVAEAGYKLAVTTMSGAWTKDSDPLAVPRINIFEDKVIGWNRRFSATMFEYATFWKAWRAMKTSTKVSAAYQRSTQVPACPPASLAGARTYGRSDPH
jgi:peptidoglycan/xylan/chitin deacetylase (PgdA/CDA1 family)